MGRNLLGDHASLILIFVAPLYWFIKSTGLLLVVQSVVIGVAAMPVYLYARERMRNGAFAVLLGSVFLLHPAVAYTNLETFHPDSFLPLFVGFASTPPSPEGGGSTPSPSSSPSSSKRT